MPVISFTCNADGNVTAGNIT